MDLFPSKFISPHYEFPYRLHNQTQIRNRCVSMLASFLSAFYFP